MSNWDLILLVVAGYIAVVSLVKLMRRRRDDVYRELEAEVERERERKSREEREARRRERREKAA